jgi:lipopolysaccharide transport system ATP-binding protein
MTVRLGFAIAAHLEPEILVVDEVLAVGDAEFQKKAIGKMQDVSKGEGRTVLFVSHNMGSVGSLCNNGIILKNGEVSFHGTIDKVIDMYISDGNTQSKYLGNHTNNLCHFREVSINNTKGENVSNLAYRENIFIKFIIQQNKNTVNSTLSFTVLDSRLNSIFTAHIKLENDKEAYTATIPAQFLLPGAYYIRPVLHVPNQLFLDKCDNDLCLNIEDTGSEFTAYLNNSELGVLNANIKWF